MIFYQGLARLKLGETGAAQTIFQTLIDYGHAHLADEIQMDYFAVSLPDFLVFDEDLNQRHRLHCRYMMALGTLGQRAFDRADQEFSAVLAIDPAHLGAALHRALGRDLEAPGRKSG